MNHNDEVKKQFEESFQILQKFISEEGNFSNSRLIYQTQIWVSKTIISDIPSPAH